MATTIKCLVCGDPITSSVLNGLCNGCYRCVTSLVTARVTKWSDIERAYRLSAGSSTLCGDETPEPDPDPETKQETKCLVCGDPTGAPVLRNMVICPGCYRSISSLVNTKAITWNDVYRLSAGSAKLCGDETPKPETKQHQRLKVVFDGPPGPEFDGPPGPESGRFIEVENEDGASVKAGQWEDLRDGTWALWLNVCPGEVYPQTKLQPDPITAVSPANLTPVCLACGEDITLEIDVERQMCGACYCHADAMVEDSVITWADVVMLNLGGEAILTGSGYPPAPLMTSKFAEALLDAMNSPRPPI